MAIPEQHRHRYAESRFTVRQRGRIVAAQAICAGCPVFDECRTWALGMPDPAVGMVAAGMTPRQRADARDRRL